MFYEHIIIYISIPKNVLLMMVWLMKQLLNIWVEIMKTQLSKLTINTLIFNDNIIF